jgi:hypothetical protein
MPFTFSHPAIILPLTYLPRRWLSLTGLVIGSLTPDFEYFLRMKVQSNFSHTIGGAFWFDLPLGLLLAFIFHHIVRDGLFNNLPGILKVRLLRFKKFGWNSYLKKNFIVVIISILIGVFSHLLWDSFTHESGYFVRTILCFTDQVEIFGKHVPFFKIAQHLSSLSGGLVIAFALLKLPKDKLINKRINFKYWIALTLIVFLVLSVRLLVGLELKQYGNLIVTGISAIIIALILTPLLVGNVSQRGS